MSAVASAETGGRRHVLGDHVALGADTSGALGVTEAVRLLDFLGAR